MNKGLRNELRQSHYRKRLRNYGIKDDTKGNFHAFKTTGQPCSGTCCQQPEDNYNRAKVKEFAKKFYEQYGEMMSQLSTE